MLWALVCIVWSGCGAFVAPVATCEAPDGRAVAVGDAFVAADGCNACTCMPGGVASCTEVACAGAACVVDGTVYADDAVVPGGPDEVCRCRDGAVDCASTAICDYAGETYAVGAMFPADDGCNTCRCDDEGRTVCTDLDCPVTCVNGEERVPVGAEVRSADGCNVCSCGEDGALYCSDRMCGPPTCEYEGEVLPLGALIPVGDGCNYCACIDDGSVQCTSRDCSEVGCALPGGGELPRGGSFNDGCNTHTCSEDGVLTSTDIDCGKACVAPDGTEVPLGTAYDDGCNTHACGEDGVLTSTDLDCGEVP